VGIIDRMFMVYGNIKGANLKRKVAKSQKKLAKARIRIEREIHLMGLNNTNENFVPSFASWMTFPELDKLNLEDVLDMYIDEYKLIQPSCPDEPENISRIATRIKILDNSKNEFKVEVQEELNKYISALRYNLMIHNMKWEVDRNKTNLDKNI
jgi:hypothetical protein